jgi:hypothetical protein
MLDFTPLKEHAQSIEDFVRGITREDLSQLTDEMIDTELAIIADASDQDIVFVSVDPNAKDDKPGVGWTLGHVIVHATASSEEAAATASALARGVRVEGRSRYETPWETVTSVAQLRQRLEESRRMRKAFLQTWPDEPHLDNKQEIPNFGTFNAISRFVLGLFHEDLHLEQLREIVRQAHVVHS